MTGRERDSRKQKLYDAENSIHPKRVNEFGTAEQTEEWLAGVMAQRWFRSRWRMKRIPVDPGRGGSATSWHGRITAGPQARNPLIMCHELAHEILRQYYETRHVASHGQEFAAVHLFLVEHVMGKDVARSLREAFVAHGVRYRNGMKVIPKPRYDVPTQAATRAEKKATAARELKPRERTDAAEVIRVAVRRGEFGAAGSKTRIAALMVARTIEKAVESR